MQIQSGKLYENRAWKYLYPSLKYYGEELMEKLASFFKVAIGIGDMSLEKNVGNCLFILIDMKLPLNSGNDMNYKINFEKFLNWVSYKDYYVTDYVFEDTYISGKHMIVLKIPEKYDFSYLDFIKGRYSKMYTKKELNKFFAVVNLADKSVEKVRNERVQNTRFVLQKDPKYIQEFCDIVNKDYKTTIKVVDFEDAELDYPPKLVEEIFNFNEIKNE